MNIVTWILLGFVVYYLWKRRKSFQGRKPRQPQKSQHRPPSNDVTRPPPKEPSPPPVVAREILADTKDPWEQKREDQLLCVVRASYFPKQIMTRTEFQVYRAASIACDRANKQHKVFAQVSLGEIVGSKDDDAFHAINSKRVDVLITDKYGNPVVAIEYQGKGHYQGSDTPLRDQVKKIALEKAGVHFVEPHHPLNTRALTDHLVGRLQEKPLNFEQRLGLKTPHTATK